MRIAALTLLASFGASQAAAQSPDVQQVEILDRQFLVVVYSKKGEPAFEETRTVPLIQGACYGWRLQVGGTVDEVAIEEVLQLPAAAENWAVSEGGAVSDDRTSATWTGTLAVEGGWITRSWCVAENDPPGAYSISLSGPGGIAETFDFEVVEPD